MDGKAIERVAVIGAGLMGHGIALELAAHGYSVWLHDADSERLDQAHSAIDEGLARFSEAGLARPEAIASAHDRIVLESDLHAAVASADLVIEAVTEDLQIKHAVFREVDAAAPPHAILASNTSSFMPSMIAAATGRSDRVLVAHYFNPPHLLPLVELVRGEHTSDATIETMRSFYLGIGKKPVVVQREAPGFVGNRLQMALLREALSIVDSGIASPHDVDTIIKSSFGRRLAFAGVFEVFDAAGWDVTLAVAEQLFAAIDRSSDPPAMLRDRVAHGALGLKSGQGFYEWSPEAAADLRQRIGRGLISVARQGGGN